MSEKRSKKSRQILRHIVQDAKLEVRALEGANGVRELVGFIPYNSKSEDMGFFEVLKPGCFTKTLNESRKIMALWNHDESMVLGSMRNGSLTFEDTADGLIVRCKLLADTSWARDAVATVESGNVNTMSFKFWAIRETWDNEFSLREILEAKLSEVSFGVAFPAYEGTDSEARNRSYIQESRNIDLDALEESLMQEKLDDAGIETVRSAITALETMLASESHGGPQEAPAADPIVDAVTDADIALFNLEHQFI